MITSKHFIIFLVILSGVLFILSGCNSRNRAGAENSGDTSYGEPLEQGKIADAIKELEQEGKYPVLDRSDTLLGVDKNKNGIRDDIEKYIDTMPKTTDDQKSALKQSAYTFNQILSPEFDAKKEEDFLKHIEEYNKAINCLDKYYGDKYRNYTATLKAYTFNTKKRLEVFLELNNTASGMSWGLSKGGCDERFFKK